MSPFAIGDFEFINLSRAISRPTQRVSREVRSGVAGVTLWRTGVRAEPFSLQSVVDAADVDAAEALIHQYEQLVGQNPVLVRWARNMLNNVQVVVLDVQPVEGGVHSMLIGVGGVTGGVSRGLCRAVWTLQSIDPGQ